MGLPVQQLGFIPALPLLAAAVGALTPRRGRALAAGAAITAISGALLLAGGALTTALAAPGVHATANFGWFDLGTGGVALGWLLDPLTGVMLVMVAAIALLIFVFSLGSMRDDPNAARFFCFLSLFAAGMLGLVAANSLLLLFVCWEIVGLASYLLIGFWFQRPAAAAAAKKAFLVTRFGDLALLLGLLWLYDAGGTLLCYAGGAGCLEPGPLAALAGRTVAGGLVLTTAISLLIFGGAVGKSGQFPLHVWLPDAMEGPTPVSALIHAATMVAAGVFLLARVHPLLAADLAAAGAPLHALTVIAFIGAITALLGAAIAVAQHDLKRVLAYSTISQLGYMTLAVGVGAWTAAIFHLLTHACFKALLFLGAGSVIHAAHHEQDIRRLGGLAPRMRRTFATFVVGAMALAGVPFLFAGFWSKEAVLHAAAGWPVSCLPLDLGLAGVALTAFYMTRLVAEVFLGAPRSPESGHAHESPAVMTVPLVLLAVGAVLLGFIGTPAWPWLQGALTGTQLEPGPLFGNGLLVAASILLVATGIGAGWWLYLRRPRPTVAAPDPLAVVTPVLWRALAGGLGIDAAYAATIGRLTLWLAALADGFDRWIWGGAVRSAAALAEFAGVLGRQADEDGFNAGFDEVSEGLRRTGRAYSRRQSGEVPGYLRALAVAFVVLVVLLLGGGGR